MLIIYKNGVLFLTSRNSLTGIFCNIFEKDLHFEQKSGRVYLL